MLVALLVLCARSLHLARLTKRTYDQVTLGMSKKQVESILGPADRSKTKDPLILKKDDVRYEGQRIVTIIFKDDEVQSKDSTFSD